MRRFILVILGESLDLASMTLAALFRQEAERAVTRLLEFAMRHRDDAAFEFCAMKIVSSELERRRRNFLP